MSNASSNSIRLCTIMLQINNSCIITFYSATSHKSHLYSFAEIFHSISAARPRADVAYCIHALARRLSKTRNWVVWLLYIFSFHSTNNVMSDSHLLGFKKTFHVGYVTEEVLMDIYLIIYRSGCTEDIDCHTSCPTRG
jgi:hypothetical protein